MCLWGNCIVNESLLIVHEEANCSDSENPLNIEKISQEKYNTRKKEKDNIIQCKTNKLLNKATARGKNA